MGNRSMQHSEFGGGPGEPRRREDGSSIPLSAAQRARIARQSVLRDLPSNSIPRTQTLTNGAGVVSSGPLPADARKIAELKAKTNGYSAEMSGDDFGERQ